MAEELKIRLTVKERQFILAMHKAGKTVDGFTKTVKNTKSATGNASQAIIELGRGASDARYGFHGLANNLERFTETIGNTIKNSGGLKGALKAIGSSILGPAGLVAGISILIAYAPEIVSFFKNSFASPARAARKEVDDLIESFKKLSSTELTKEQKAVMAAQNAINAAKKEAKLLNDELERGGKMITVYNQQAAPQQALQKITPKRKAEIQKRLELLKNAIFDAESFIQDAGVKSKKEAVKAAKAFSQEFNNSLDDFLDPEGATKKFTKAFGDSLKGEFKSTFESIFGGSTDPLSNAIGSKNKVKNVSNVEVVDESDVDLFLSNEAISNYNKRLESIKEWTQNTTDIISGAFNDLGNNIASSLAATEGVFGAFVGTIIQQLTKLVAAEAAAAIKQIGIKKSVAAAGAVASATQTASASGPAAAVLLPVLIAGALAAVSSAFSGIGGGGVGGGGGSSRVGKINPTSTSTAVNTTSDTSNNLNLVARIKGQDLEFALQGADYSRAGYIPT